MIEVDTKNSHIIVVLRSFTRVGQADEVDTGGKIT